MAPAGKISSFYREGNDWFCNASLPSDITIEVEGVFFHLHKFPLMSRCGKIANILEESQDKDSITLNAALSEFPGGPDIFLVAAKFCYGIRVELTSKNIVMVFCAADYLEMTEEYGEENLLAKSESFFHKNTLHNWKDCILALQSSDPVIPRAEKLQIEKKCLNSISMMACTDPSLFGWPMKMYGSLQSPGGSILWNGINTGARIRSSESDWWFEDVSYLSVPLFERLIQTMNSRGMRPETLAAAVMYYARKYLPGLGRWQSGQSGKPRTVASFSLTPVTVDQKLLLESIEKLLPEKKGKSFCRFLLGLLRVAMILDVSQPCKDSLERRVGIQLDLATLDSLLIPSYSDSDTLYNTDCVERIIQHFLSEPSITSFSPSSFDQDISPSSAPLKKVAKLVDNYIAEVAADVNLKPEKLQFLLEALPECSRSLHDGLYRALDIYFKEHPWLSENEKEQLCNVIDYQKLSIDACAHASQNKRLPLRVILQVLFFEQLQFRTALAGCLHVLDNEGGPTGVATTTSDMAGQIMQRDGWFTVVRENQVLRVDMERMRTRVGELERECGRIKQEMQRVAKSHSSLSSPHLLARRFGCKLLPRLQNVQADTIENVGRSPRVLIDQARSSRPSRHRKSFSLFGVQCKE
ncbi:BTB/POZ domain-containing protein At3g44820-like [Macadamia integrifolia]|uniref:BTB/POZ domain-containing protein At3g44820-like n=1 Tax=Macadamia integrifolia TaxID=60698 RepID=UPI001C4F47E7|nr:BTB/POZ domain-containing protein At3g44820-like [Macadamia integrifolia]